MKRNELEVILGEGASKDTLDAIMALHGSSVNKLKAESGDASARNDELSKALEAANARIAGFEAAQKASESTQEQLDKLMRDLSIERSQNAVKDVLRGCGLSDEQLAEQVSSLSGENLEDSVARAKALASAFASIEKAAAAKAVNDAMVGTKPPAGMISDDVKSKFAGMSLTEKAAAIQADPSLKSLIC